eukprot:TRINITY_DN7209_c0_g1_i2.p1 TRINITY_DN7209_c0_g1~~TRINITY_DN7209_c0_g1_i2.p1  ORF type:complete len:2046 (-),score=241.54 TRINITY_DN7209_c0_g1_i2:12-6149(-)
MTASYDAEAVLCALWRQVLAESPLPGPMDLPLPPELTLPSFDQEEEEKTASPSQQLLPLTVEDSSQVSVVFSAWTAPDQPPHRASSQEIWATDQVISNFEANLRNVPHSCIKAYLCWLSSTPSDELVHIDQIAPPSERFPKGWYAVRSVPRTRQACTTLFFLGDSLERANAVAKALSVGLSYEDTDKGLVVAEVLHERSTHVYVCFRRLHVVVPTHPSDDTTHLFSSYISLSPEQVAIVDSPNSVLLQGRSGTGKTVVITQRIRNRKQNGRQLFITRSTLLLQSVVRELVRSGCSVRTYPVAPDDKSWQVLALTFAQFERLVSDFLTAEKIQCPVPPSGYVDFDRFEKHLWPKMSALVRKLDPNLVWTEFVTRIAGSFERAQEEVRAAIAAGKDFTQCKPYLTRQEYQGLGQSALGVEVHEKDRAATYSAFLQYCEMKTQHRLVDATDTAWTLLYLLASSEFADRLQLKGVLVDEVQDFSPAEIVLFTHICKNPRGLTLAGDTCQTINPGCAFSFFSLYNTLCASGGQKRGRITHKFSPTEVDLRSLGKNYRSSSGVLDLAQTLVALLEEYFPGTIDRLQPETSVTHSLPPLYCYRPPDVSYVDVLSPLRLPIDEEQVLVIVRNSAARKKLERDGVRATILTIHEAKGLEYDFVVLVDFFEDCPHKQAGKLWNVVSTNERSRMRALLQQFQQSAVHSLTPKQRSELYDIIPLVSELKILYTALTRARRQVCMIESNMGKPKNTVLHWLESGVIRLFRWCHSAHATRSQVQESLPIWVSPSYQETIVETQGGLLKELGGILRSLDEGYLRRVLSRANQLLVHAQDDEPVRWQVYYEAAKEFDVVRALSAQLNLQDTYLAQATKQLHEALGRHLLARVRYDESADRAADCSLAAHHFLVLGDFVLAAEAYALAKKPHHEAYCYVRFAESLRESQNAGSREFYATAAHRFTRASLPLAAALCHVQRNEFGEAMAALHHIPKKGRNLTSYELSEASLAIIAGAAAVRGGPLTILQYTAHHAPVLEAVSTIFVEQIQSITEISRGTENCLEKWIERVGVVFSSLTAGPGAALPTLHCSLLAAFSSALRNEIAHKTRSGMLARALDAITHSKYFASLSPPSLSAAILAGVQVDRLETWKGDEEKTNPAALFILSEFYRSVGLRLPATRTAVAFAELFAPWPETLEWKREFSPRSLVPDCLLSNVPKTTDEEVLRRQLYSHSPILSGKSLQLATLSAEPFEDNSQSRCQLWRSCSSFFGWLQVRPLPRIAATGKSHVNRDKPKVITVLHEDWELCELPLHEEEEETGDALDFTLTEVSHIEPEQLAMLAGLWQQITHPCYYSAALSAQRFLCEYLCAVPVTNALLDPFAPLVSGVAVIVPPTRAWTAFAVAAASDCFAAASRCQAVASRLQYPLQCLEENQAKAERALALTDEFVNGLRHILAEEGNDLFHILSSMCNGLEQKALPDVNTVRSETPGYTRASLVALEAETRQRIVTESLESLHNGIPVCPICLEWIVLRYAVVLVCGHLLHTECLNRLTRSQHSTCPTCRMDLIPVTAAASHILLDAEPYHLTLDLGASGLLNASRAFYDACGTFMLGLHQVEVEERAKCVRNYYPLIESAMRDVNWACGNLVQNLWTLQEAQQEGAHAAVVRPPLPTFVRNLFALLQFLQQLGLAVGGGLQYLGPTEVVPNSNGVMNLARQGQQLRSMEAEHRMLILYVVAKNTCQRELPNIHLCFQLAALACDCAVSCLPTHFARQVARAGIYRFISEAYLHERDFWVVDAIRSVALRAMRERERLSQRLKQLRGIAAEYRRTGQRFAVLNDGVPTLQLKFLETPAVPQSDLERLIMQACSAAMAFRAASVPVVKAIPKQGYHLSFDVVPPLLRSARYCIKALPRMTIHKSKRSGDRSATRWSYDEDIAVSELFILEVHVISGFSPDTQEGNRARVRCVFHPVGRDALQGIWDISCSLTALHPAELVLLAVHFVIAAKAVHGHPVNVWLVSPASTTNILMEGLTHWLSSYDRGCVRLLSPQEAEQWPGYGQAAWNVEPMA